MTEQSPHSQCAMILRHFKRGKTLTSLEALTRFGCIYLPRRILDLKERGHNIVDVWIRTDSGKRVKQWGLGA